MDKPLLSICIPTYNRCEYLKNSLNSIICQKEFQNGRVEIVISDNASTDDTEKLGRDYASRFKNIRYFRNQENIRDKNFPVSLQRGIGLFRKLSNDYFVYLPRSLDFLCSVIDQYRNSNKTLFLMNAQIKGQDKIVKCLNFDDFVRLVGIWTEATASFGLWEEECENITNDISGCELQLWQCCKILERVAVKGEAVIINHRLLFGQEVAKKNMSYGVYQVLHLNFLSILDEYMEKGLLTHETYEKTRRDSLYRFVYYLIRGEHKWRQWNFPEKDTAQELIFNEAKRVGIWDEYQKCYKKGKLIYPAEIDMKIILMDFYCTYLSLRVKHLHDKTARIEEVSP